MKKFIALALLFSLALNSYLLLKLREADSEMQVLRAAGVDARPCDLVSIKQSKTSDTAYEQMANNKQTSANYEASAQGELTYNPQQELSDEALFALIKSLQSQQKYAELVLPLREYLRTNPHDYKALLVEADLTLHTEPLSTAIAFYYQLLDKNLPREEEEKIRRLIQVNTSKVIQQLASDASWDLLATFIEPLLQIDPLNTRYILGLAQAYAKQGQVNLMENVLAALPYEDTRAQRLRNSAYQADVEIASSDTNEEEPVQTASVSKRRVPVSSNGRQFFVRTKFYRYQHTLLIDTGASTTAISNEVFIKLPSKDKEFIGRFSVQTAGGAIEAPLYKLSAVTLGEITLNNVSVIVLPNESFTGPFKGLLGMNILRNFDLRFDPEKQKMTLFER